MPAGRRGVRAGLHTCRGRRSLWSASPPDGMTSSASRRFANARADTRIEQNRETRAELAPQPYKKRLDAGSLRCRASDRWHSGPASQFVLPWSTVVHPDPVIHQGPCFNVTSAGRFQRTVVVSRHFVDEPFEQGRAYALAPNAGGNDHVDRQSTWMEPIGGHGTDPDRLAIRLRNERPSKPRPIVTVRNRRIDGATIVAGDEELGLWVVVQCWAANEQALPDWEADAPSLCRAHGFLAGEK